MLKPKDSNRRRVSDCTLGMNRAISALPKRQPGDMSKAKHGAIGATEICLVLLCFFATFLAYWDRVGFSIAYTKLASEGGIDQKEKGGVLAAFYYGYATSQIPCAWLASRYGAFRMLTAQIVVSSVAAFFTPADASQTSMVVAARFMVGVSQGAIFPAIHTELGKWKDSIGPQYFSTVVSLITSGMYLGSAVAMLFLPGVSAGEPSRVFRLQATLGSFWLMCWLAAHAIKTDDSRDFEKDPESNKELDGKSPEPVKPSIPWLRLLSSMAIWALIMNNFAFHYIVYVLMAWLPTYFEKALKLDMSSTTWISILPFLMMFIFSNLSGVLADRLIGYMGVPVGYARKILNNTGFVLAAVVLLFLPGVTHQATGIVGVSAVLGGCAVARGGFALNHLDVAPTYAGSVMSLANTAGTIAGIVGVSITGLLLHASGGESWNTVFHFLAAVCLAGATIFGLCSSGERLF